MYKVTFYGVVGTTEITVETVEALRVITESGASVMVEWGDGEWGDAVNGVAVTSGLFDLLYPTN